MSPEQTQWMPALIALGIGAIAGIFFLFRARRARPSNPQDLESAVTLRDLEQERESIVAQLRELDDVAPDARADRLELELQGARVLREIERVGAARGRPESRSAKTESPGARRAPLHEDDETAPKRPANPWTAFAWGVVTVFIVAAIGVFVANSTAPKEGSAMAPAAQASAVAAAPDFTQLEAAVKANPDNVEMRLALARQYLINDRLMEVYAHTEHVLQRDPQNAAALTYQSIVRLAMGETDTALSMVQRALERDPDFIDAYVQLALIHSNAGRAADAEKAMHDAMARHPEEKQALESILAQMQAQPGA